MWGRPTHVVRAVTTQVEPEWDAEGRAAAEALARYDDEVCPDCGLHHSILDEPDKFPPLKFEDSVCQVGAALQRHLRALAARDHEWERVNPAPDPGAGLKVHLQAARRPHPADGRHTRLRFVSADEIAAQAAPSKPERPKEG